MSSEQEAACSCGAVYKNKISRDAHVEAMRLRNATLPEIAAKDDINRREKHEPMA